ncbi:MAG TPA: MBL fold metallo-hydrolase [Burkholderiaceae bacterium]|nr:MBL fold metallo-hydrolase [Burkholderiaceae bacterium]
MTPHALEDLTVFERGWLSSNNILLHGRDGEGATLVDTGYVSHAAQTVALVRHALRPGTTLARIVNTHLHSDHCGGNAALQRAFPAARLAIPPGEAPAVARWDEAALSYRDTGQRCERFAHDAVLSPGASLAVGTRTWQAHAAPGHDPHSLVLFDAADGVLISADALWANGFGVVFPELDGVHAFDVVAATLDLIERLQPRLVIPGHGAPFTDVQWALQRARSRLASFVADPVKHARHGAKVLVKYHLLEVQREPLPALHAWFAATPLVQRVWQRIGRPERTPAAWLERLLAELAAGGALALRDGVVHDTA